jgi:prepilin-type N-terminal cleavage/methylation domain-containing protein
MRGVTLIEAMVSVAILGIATGTTFLEVSGYRSRVSDVRRGYRALGCAEREVEWLKVQPRAEVRALAGKAYVPRWCEAPAPAMRLSWLAAQDVFVLEVEEKPGMGPPRTISLPFLPTREMGR